MLSDFLQLINNRIQGFKTAVGGELDQLLDWVRRTIEESQLDPKTRLFNEASLHLLCEQASKNVESPSVLVLADVNGMKRVNDSKGGHQAGDVVLLRIAARLAEVATEHKALAFHQSGDEYAILMPLNREAPTLKLEALKADLLRHFKEFQVRYEDTPYKVSLSFGAIVFDGKIESRVGIKRADQALRAAKAEDAEKQEGGTVVVWDPEVTLPEFLDMRKKCSKCGSTASVTCKKMKFEEGKSFASCPVCTSPFA